MSVFNLLSIVIYVLIGRNHRPLSLTEREWQDKAKAGFPNKKRTLLGSFLVLIQFFILPQCALGCFQNFR